MTSFLLLQLVDGAFPSGGFAHSAGLEACTALSPIALDAFFVQSMRGAARGGLPFVRATCAAPARLADLDRLYDATSTSHVANRASRAQGRAFASAALRVFPSPRVADVAAAASRGPSHHAPVLGAVLGALGVAPAEAAAAFLHTTARGLLSAAVRLGSVGPLEAQRIQAAHAGLLDELLASSMHLEPEESAQTAPLVELFGALHDDLDGRLFQS
jgi:urease accessory protein